jgi:transcriptional regulator with XRE-family HTH domain
MCRMRLEARLARTRHRDLLRAIGEEVRRLRFDAGLSQRSVASAAGIAQSHLSRVEAGEAEPGIEVLLRVARVLGADLSVRLFPNSGPAIHDRTSVPMTDALLRVLSPRWRRALEVGVVRPVRGVIDLVLEDRTSPATVASEVQGQVRRVEQQIRWANQKADALAALPEQQGRHVSRLLVLRNSHATRDVVHAAGSMLATAYPASTAAAVRALTSDAPWPGSSLVWMRVERGSAEVMERPPRGIVVGRPSADRSAASSRG